jgi:hypothetical protein
VELADHPDSDDMVAAVVLEAKPKEITAMLSTGEEISISGAGLGFGANLLSDKAPPQKKIRRGAIIRVFQDGNSWIITQMPEVESAFVSVNSRWRDPLAGGRLRLQPQQVQPRHAGLAPAGFVVQALHLFVVAGKGLVAGHHHQ